jgi:putative NIF3 family GTP cyclohydrolase 1 type 2
VSCLLLILLSFADRAAPLPLRRRSFASAKLAFAVTTPVLREALASPSTTTILTYHPPIFSGLKSLTLRTPLQRSLLECVSNGISVFCIHTAADNALHGVNDFMGEGLLKASRSAGGKGSCKAITVKEDAPGGQEGAGSGRLVDLGEELTKAEIVAAVKETLGRDWSECSSFLSLVFGADINSQFKPPSRHTDPKQSKL